MTGERDELSHHWDSIMGRNRRQSVILLPFFLATSSVHSPLFRHQVQITMDEIIPGLWIGDLPSALDVEGLKARSIFSILSAMRGRVTINEVLFHLDTSKVWEGSNTMIEDIYTASDQARRHGR